MYQNGTLVIKDAKFQDSDQYRCTVTSDQGTESNKINIRIGRRKHQDTSTKDSVRKVEKLSEEKVQTPEKIQTLEKIPTLEKIDKPDPTKTSALTNPGEISRASSVKVESNTVWVDEPKSLKASLNQQITVKCKTSNQRTSAKWFDSKGFPILQTSSIQVLSGTLYFQDFQKRNVGKYTCRSSGLQKTISVTVSSIPVYIKRATTETKNAIDTVHFKNCVRPKFALRNCSTALAPVLGQF